MKLSLDFLQKLLSFPIRYYHDFFDVYRLADRAVYKEFDFQAADIGIHEITVVAVDRGDELLRKDFFTALADQKLRPAEIILAADTQDEESIQQSTLQESFGIPVRVVASSNPSSAHLRNQAIQASRHKLILLTDTSCQPGPDWVSTLIQPLVYDQDIDFCFSRRLGDKAKRLASVVIPGDNLTNFRPYLRSVSFRKKIWAQVEGIPEDVPRYTEDALFAMRLKKTAQKYTIFEGNVTSCDRFTFWRQAVSQLFLRAVGYGKLGIEASISWKLLPLTGLLLGSVLSSYLVSLIIMQSWSLSLFPAVLIGLLIIFLWAYRIPRTHQDIQSISILQAVEMGIKTQIWMLGYGLGVLWRPQARKRLQNQWIHHVQEIVARHPDRKGIIVYFPTHDWGFMFQRPQQMARHFAREGYLYFYGSKNEVADYVAGILQVERNLFLYSLPLETFQCLENPIIYLGSPWFASWMERFQEATIIYDHYDVLEISNARISDHELLVQNADLILVSSSQLKEEVSNQRSDVIFVPNAVDYEFIQEQKPDHLSTPPQDLVEILGKDKPIIGYMGALANWFDYDLIRSLAAAHPEWEWVLIGSDYDESLSKSGLTWLDNVTWLGPKPYQVVFDYTWRFTVAIIPFIINQITKATSPVKLFEYFACEKAVVTTPLPECKKFSEVLIAENSVDFSREIERAIYLGKKPDYHNRIREIALQNTWTCRVRKVVERIQEIRS